MQGGPRAHVWNRVLVSHDEVRAVKVNGHSTERDVEVGRISHLCKKGNDLADSFAKKGADTHKPAFRVAKTVVACASLAKQAARWAAEAHVLLRFRVVERHQGCCATSTGTAAASETQAQAAKGDCSTNVGR